MSGHPNRGFLLLSENRDLEHYRPLNQLSELMHYQHARASQLIGLLIGFTVGLYALRGFPLRRFGRCCRYIGFATLEKRRDDDVDWHTRQNL